LETNDLTLWLNANVRLRRAASGHATQKVLIFGATFALTAYRELGLSARGEPAFLANFFLSPDDGWKQQPKKMPRRAEIGFARPDKKLRLT
jgi:hypothetical protein